MIVPVRAALLIPILSTRVSEQHLWADDRVDQHDTLRVGFPEHPFNDFAERFRPACTCGGDLMNETDTRAHLSLLSCE